MTFQSPKIVVNDEERRIKILNNNFEHIIGDKN